MPDQIIQAGKVVIAQNFWDNELYHRSVILILEHNERGTTGIILNKAKYVADTIPLFASSKYERQKETAEDYRPGFMNQIRSLAKTIRISDEVFYHAHSLQLQKIISEERSGTPGIRAFLGFTVWEPGQLEQEIKEKKWWLGDFKSGELQQIESKKLWEYKLLSSGHLYGLFGSIPDPGLN
ncbi:MAG: YqgE/AlgH family protein [Bacteroidia bacterium]